MNKLPPPCHFCGNPETPGHSCWGMWHNDVLAIALTVIMGIALIGFVKISLRYLNKTNPPHAPRTAITIDPR